MKHLIKIFLIAATSIMPTCMILPYAAITLKAMGHSESAIGIFLALPFTGLLLSSMFVPKMVNLLGVRGVFIATGVMPFFHLACLYFYPNYYILCAANFLFFGLAWGMRWVLTETLINEYAPENKKGMAIGIYGTLICAFVTIGPLLLTITGQPILLAAVLYFISWLVTLTLANTSYATDGEKNGIRNFILQNPVLVLASLIGGVMENGVGNVTALYSIDLGFTTTKAPLIPAIISFGTFSTQYIIGVLTDKFRNTNLYLYFSALLLLTSLPIFLAPELPNIIFLSAFFWGACGGGIYTIILINLGYKYSGATLVISNSALIIGYTIGGILGPLLSGIAVDANPLYGLPFTVSLFALLMLIISRKKYA